MTEFTVSLCDESTMWMERTAKISYNPEMTEGEFVHAAQEGLEIPQSSALAFVRADTKEDVVLSDTTVMEELCKVDPLPVLTVNIQAAEKPKKTAQLSLYREGDFMAAATDAEMNFDAAEHGGIRALLRLAVIHAVEGLSDDSNLSYSVMIDFEKTPINSDRQMHEILLLQAENNSKVEVYFTVASKAATKDIKLQVLKAEQLSPEFTTAFSVLEAEGLKQNVLIEANNALNAGNDDEGFGQNEGEVDVTQQSLAVVIEGAKQIVTSDRLLAEVFLAHLDSEAKDAPLRLIVETDALSGIGANQRATSNQVSVEATYNNMTTANFTINFQPDQPNILEALKQEVRGELDLALDTKIALVATVENIEGEVALHGDKQLSEILAAKPSGAVLSVAVAEEKEETVYSLDVVCREEDQSEEGSFTYKFRFDEANALRALRVDIEEQLDLDSGAFDLLYVSEEDSETAIVGSDRLLREIIQEHITSGNKIRFLTRSNGRNSPLVNDDASNGVVKASQVFNLFFGEDSTTFSFTWIPDLTTLVVFEQEVRGELDIFEGDLLLEAHVEGEKYTITKDKDLEEVIQKQSPEVNVKVTLRDSPNSAPCLWVNATVLARLGDKREEASWFFRCAPSQTGSLSAFIADLRNELELDDESSTGGAVQVQLYFDTEDDKSLVDSDQKILALASAEPSNITNRFTAEITLPPPAPVAASTANRLAEMNALISEWKDALEDTFAPSDIEQMVLTFHIEGVPLPTDDPLMTRLNECIVENVSKPVSDLSDTMELWTKHFADDVFSSFCHHCREMLDFVVEYSPITRLKRTITLVFRQLSVGSKVTKDGISQVLNDSRTINGEDIQECLKSYDEYLDATQFSEAMHWLFRDKPQMVVDVLTTVQAAQNRSPTRARREVELLRRKRLQSEIRHAMDGVTPYHMGQFASANRETNEQDWLNLAHAVATLLGEECAAREATDSWQWLIGHCEVEEKAYTLLSRLTKTGRSYSSADSVAKASAILISPGCEAASLLASARLLSGLAVWALRIAQLTCHAQRWMWPPLLSSVTHAEAPEAHHIGSPIRIRPPDTPRETQLIPRPPKYQFKHTSRNFDGISDEPPRKGSSVNKTLKELMAEQKNEMSEETTKDEDSGTNGNAEDKTAAETNGDAEESPVEAEAEKEEESAPVPVEAEKEEESAPVEAEAEKEEESAPVEAEKEEESAPVEAEAEKEEESAPVDEDDEKAQNDAAAKIQAIQRGKAGRDKAAAKKAEKVQEEKEQNDAAAKIQAIQRGKQGREKAAAKKAEKEEAEKGDATEEKEEEAKTEDAPAETTVNDEPKEVVSEDAKTEEAPKDVEEKQEESAKEEESKPEEEKKDAETEEAPATSTEEAKTEDAPAETTVNDEPKEVVSEDAKTEEAPKAEEKQEEPAKEEESKPADNAELTSEQKQEQNDAAAKIQAIQRGKQGREKAAAKKAEKEEAEKGDATEEKKDEASKTDDAPKEEETLPAEATVNDEPKEVVKDDEAPKTETEETPVDDKKEESAKDDAEAGAKPGDADYEA